MQSEKFEENPSRTLAIDPGYDRLGWAVGEKDLARGPSRAANARNDRVLEYGLITTKREEDHYHRYWNIDEELTAIVKKWQPRWIVLEKLFLQKNQKTVMGVSEVRGVIMSVGFRHGLELVEFTPPQVKQAVTGYGRAEKGAVEKMVRLELNLDPKVKIIDDTIDALAILLTQLSSWRSEEGRGRRNNRRME